MIPSPLLFKRIRTAPPESKPVMATEVGVFGPGEGVEDDMFIVDLGWIGSKKYSVHGKYGLNSSAKAGRGKTWLPPSIIIIL